MDVYQKFWRAFDAQFKRKTLFFVLLFLLIAAIVTITMYCYAHWVSSGENSMTIQAIGAGNSFGDAFGAINAWFSGLAFAGVVAALIMQTTALSLQRNS